METKDPSVEALRSFLKSIIETEIASLCQEINDIPLPSNGDDSEAMNSLDRIGNMQDNINQGVDQALNMLARVIAREKVRENCSKVARSMATFGGGFVKPLGMALANADKKNLGLIYIAWSGYWNEYLKLSKRLDDDPDGNDDNN